VTRQLRYALEAALVYLLYGVFWMLPLPAASALGGWAMRLIGPRLRLSKVGQDNLSLAFPEKSAAEKNKIMDGMWDNLGRVAGEYPHLRRIGPQVELVGQNFAEAMRDGGQPALMFAGHLGNWEIPALRCQTGLGIHIVYREPNNALVDGLLQHARRFGCIGQIRKGGKGAREIVTALHKSGVIGMLADQKLNEGLPIPFFGHDAMTAPAIAHFCLKFGCPIYPFRTERIAGCRFRATVYPPLTIARTGDKNADVRRILEDINRVLEGWVRERPEQWLWIHRRWPKAQV
jgi:Kdo2-lipid IVA lauroyltransferase/acyltransferase